MKKVILIGVSIFIFIVILSGIFSYAYYVQDESILACRVLGGKLHRDENQDVGFVLNEIRICKTYDQTPGKLSNIGYCTTGCNGSILPTKEKRLYDTKRKTEFRDGIIGNPQIYIPN